MESKRQYRELSDETKQKISASSKGKSKSFAHRELLSQSLKNYWRTIPNKPKQTTMDEFLGKGNQADNQ